MTTPPNPAAWYKFDKDEVLIDFYGDGFVCDKDEILGIIEYLQSFLREKNEDASL